MTAKDDNSKNVQLVSNYFAVPKEISPIPDLEANSVTNKASGSSKRKKNGSDSNNIENQPDENIEEEKSLEVCEGKEKRIMDEDADLQMIFGAEADIFFTQSKKIVEQKIRKMNHSTRFYLGTKFYRQSCLDFKRDIKSKYSKKDMCILLGIAKTSVVRTISEIPENESLINYMKEKGFQTTIENNPHKHEHYFKLHASNYEELNKRGLFKEN